MPRFLDTVTGQFVCKDDAAGVVYAILSHTWRSAVQGGEQSFDDIRRLQAEVEDQRNTLGSGSVSSATSINAAAGDAFPHNAVDALGPTIFTHPTLSDKVKGACEAARKAGYRLLWNDACCIDKSSSAELSEAINSMYEWYRLADVCYVYLEDVPDDDVPGTEESRFPTSKWHRRGWTLQELIAPKRVVFLTQSWRFYGTKLGLASLLERISGIPSEVLVGLTPLDSVSVARRMSWAARRETTRVEDRAYSLMGIFGVHMSTIYGEGRNAFLRLQEAIMRAIPDQSIFAWGQSCRLLESLKNPHPKVSRYGPYNVGLLANSPRDFEHCDGIRILSPTEFALRLARRVESFPSLHSVFTSQGVEIRLLCIELEQIYPAFSRTLWGDSVCDDCMRLGRTHALGLLQCVDEDDSLVTLPLCRARSDAGEGQRGLLIGTHVRCPTTANQRNMNGHEPFHTIHLTKDALAEALEHIAFTPIQVSLLRHHSASVSLDEPRAVIGPGLRSHDNVFWAEHGAERVQFRIAPRCAEELGAQGFALSPLRCKRSNPRTKGKIILATSLLGVATESAHARPQESARQPLKIKLSLSDQRATWTFSPFAKSLLGLAAPADVTARFSVASTDYTIRSTTHGIPRAITNYPSQHIPSALQTPSRSHGHGEGSPASDGRGVHTLRFHSETFRTEGTQIQAEFIVINDGGLDESEDIVEVRLLRVALQRSTREDADSNPTHWVAWLSVELSSPLNWDGLDGKRPLPRAVSILSAEFGHIGIADISTAHFLIFSTRQGPRRDRQRSWGRYTPN